MAEQGPEVRTKLTLDDAASDVLARIRQGFQKTDTEQKKTKKGFREHFRELGQDLQAFYQGTLPAIRSVQQLGRELLSAAAEGEAADRALGAMMATVQDRSFEDATKDAASLNDELDMVAIRAGVAGDSVGRAFQTMIEITGASKEGVATATDQIGKMAMVAGVLGKDTESIAREFAFMGEGILRTRGQLTMLLKQTGIFGDDLKKAAAGWGKLTDEERAKRLSYGLGQLSEKLEKAEPGFNQLAASAKTAWDVAKEKLGEPLIAALVPALKDVTERMKAAIPSIERFAKTLGPTVGRWVKSAVDTMERAFRWVETHAEEIKSAIETGARMIKETVQFVLDHKEALSAAWGVSKVAEMAGMTAAATGGKAFGMDLGKATGITNVAVVAIAAAAIGLLADQIAKAMKEGVFTSEADKDQAARMEALKDAAARGGLMQQAGYAEAREAAMADVYERKAAFAEASVPGRMPAEELAAHAASIAEAERVARAGFEELERIDAAAIRWQEEMSGLADAAEVSLDPTAILSLVMSYEQATAVQNAAQQHHIANLLSGSNELAYAFAESTALTEEGFMGLIETLRVLAPDLANELGMLRVMAGMGKAEKKPGKQTFDFRGSSITIKQDFRDQDPDRVAIFMKRDLMRMAETRVRATTGYPFGT